MKNFKLVHLVLSSVGFVTMLFVSQASARTVWLEHPQGNWATVIIENSRSRNRDEILCQGTDAVKLFDALKIRAEAGTDAAIKRTTFFGIKLKCENVTGFGFVSCGMQFTPSQNVSIDVEKDLLKAVWIGDEAMALNKLWEHSCAGNTFQTDDGLFQISWSDSKVEMTFGSR